MRIATWPEIRMGVNVVRLVLRDGSRIDGVVVADGRAVGIYSPDGPTALPVFQAEDVLDAEDDSSR
jgi:hypothetical protein